MLVLSLVLIYCNCLLLVSTHFALDLSTQTFSQAHFELVNWACGVLFSILDSSSCWLLGIVIILYLWACFLSLCDPCMCNLNCFSETSTHGTCNHLSLLKAFVIDYLSLFDLCWDHVRCCILVYRLWACGYSFWLEGFFTIPH